MPSRNKIILDSISELDIDKKIKDFLEWLYSVEQDEKEGTGKNLPAEIKDEAERRIND